MLDLRARLGFDCGQRIPIAPEALAASRSEGTLYVGAGVAGEVRRLDTDTLQEMPAIEAPTVDGEVKALHVPEGRVEAYGTTLRDCDPDCTVAIERFSTATSLDAAFKDVATSIDPGVRCGAS